MPQAEVREVVFTCVLGVMIKVGDLALLFPDVVVQMEAQATTPFTAAQYMRFDGFWDVFPV